MIPDSCILDSSDVTQWLSQQGILIELLQHKHSLIFWSLSQRIDFEQSAKFSKVYSVENAASSTLVADECLADGTRKLEDLGKKTEHYLTV
ncbi:hypothetical protein [Brasilonema bromeliae]|uniref:Uncharacterized protein n=1 Tax=Brasilonema bromeliae SPC951 TaxID=385972 RepID=A0ABX1P9J4_9CYAN|nr:hypothetical protein [Brasilonema bromeliae]NMG21084.1 hypothetical protein [Brasilonema bromeliae SPC951]